MARQWKIGSINTTPVTITLPWIGVFLVVTLNFGSVDMIYTMSQLLPVEKQLNVPTATLTNLGFGFIAAAGIYGGILLHEIGHSEIAKRNDVGINKIELFLFGAKAEMEEEPNTPLKAFKIAAAGPLVSLLLGVALLVINITFYQSLTPTLFALTTSLTFGNFIIAIFNLIPAYPLDGGRILKAIFETQYPTQKATQRTMESSKTIGFCIAVLSIQFIEPVGLLFAGFLYVTSEYNSNDLSETNLTV